MAAEVPGQFAGRGGDVGPDHAVRLPPRRFSFVGRTADLAEVAARLGRCSVVTLTGVGGVGKTSLAIETAWAEVSAGRAKRAFYVDLVPCRTGEQVVAALVEGVGIQGAGAAAGLDAATEAVSGCRSLLVLDNCEHVLEPVRGACDQLSGRTGDLRILVTSRIPLDIAARLADAGEQDLARWGHARAFLARAETIEPMLFEPKAEQHCDLLELDRPDHDAALGWLLSCGAAEEAQRLAAALYFFWYTRGWFITGLQWLRAAEAPVERLVRLRAEVGLAQLAFIAGDYLASFAAIESALPTARSLGDDVVLARCLATAGYVWWFLDPERSAALSRRAWRLPTAAVMAGPGVPAWPGWAGPAITPHVSTRPSARCRTLSS